MIEIMTAKAPLQRAVESSLPTGTFPPNTIPWIPYNIKREGATIDKSRCPAAVESEVGTVHDEKRTRMKPSTHKIRPGVLEIPLILNHMPNGTAQRGIQNQIAASSIESITLTATL